MPPDLTDLQLVVHVHERGTIASAAEAMHLAPASAGARLRTLEARLGGPLFVRGAHRLAPTPFGSALLAHARRVLGQLEALERELGGHRSGASGRVRILGNTAGCHELLPESLGDFLPAHPDVEVVVDERRSEVVVDGVRSGAAELGLVSDAVDRGDLATVALRTDPLVVVLPRGHRLEGRGSLTLTDLLPEAIVGLSADRALQSLVESHARDAGGALRCRVRVPGLDAVCRLVARGVAPGLVPQSVAHRFRGLAAIPLQEGWARRRLLLVARSFDQLAPPARRLARHLQAAVEAAG